MTQNVMQVNLFAMQSKLKIKDELACFIGLQTQPRTTKKKEILHYKGANNFSFIYLNLPITAEFIST